ncbi:peptidyl-prolyl cis-trans isomerase SurA [Novosphingobium sp. SG751A]|nr:peptidylprolyl isomerase [Novosphingobium sp. SG751A]NOW46902.1 peptidyl-prolyl cis-trans isomerase SurA [Novosphingobium sp. SG751A]
MVQVHGDKNRIERKIMVVTKKAGSGSAVARARTAARMGALVGLSLALAAQGFAQAPVRTKAPAAATKTPAAKAPAAKPAEAAAPTATDPFGIGQNVTMLGKDNPNLRRATAIVNGDIITGTDVNQRLALILAANGGKVAPEEVERLRAQVLRNLIDETLQIQESKNADIKIDEGEVEGTYARVAQENFKQEPAALDAYLARIGSSPNSLKRQIRGEMAWNRVLRRNVQPFVNVSQQEVKELLERMKASKGTEEYRLGEIYLSATPDSRSIVAENAQRIMSQLKEGGSFAAYARQYSEASTKAVGGDLGWIRLAQLPTELAASAREMQTGQLVGPIEMRGGFSILYLIDKRQVLTADPRDAVLALKQITLALPANIAEAEANKKIDEFSNAIKSAKGCGGVDAVAGKLGAQVVANDQIRARDLPAPLQQSLLALSLGETTPPFGSVQEGIRMLMLCGRDDPKAASGPSFEELMSQMEEDRVNKRAQMYMRDLRRDAIIEYN